MYATSDLRFHVIYTPGTFQYLRPFLFSLLRWSDCRFRVVSNGCGKSERRLIESTCRRSSRLEVIHFRQKAVLPKGRVLNALYTREKGRFFCCMDSDIFAVGQWLDEVVEELGHHAAIFSAPHFLMSEEGKTMPAKIEGAFGIHVRDPEGHCIGTTCFAIYDKKISDAYIHAKGIDFSGTAWAHVPAAYRSCFVRRGLQVKEFNSGKILNICMSCDGASLFYRNLENLRHIGGFSFAKPNRLHGESIPTSRDRRADYFYELLRSVANGAEPPPLPECSQHAIQKYRNMVTEIIALTAARKGNNT